MDNDSEKDINIKVVSKTQKLSKTHSSENLTSVRINIYIF